MTTWKYAEGLAQARTIAVTSMVALMKGDKHYLKAKEIVAYCARVSNPENQEETSTYPRLLKYLIKHKHWSPFEMINLLVEIKIPRDISRQLIRHSFNVQEFSQRYAEATEFVLREARLQDIDNRQSSIDLDQDDKLHIEWLAMQAEVIEVAEQAYQWALKNNIAKECARVVLPEGNTMSSLYVNGNLRNWIHYLEARLEKGTQKEHRALATCIYMALADVVGTDMLSEQQPPLLEDGIMQKMEGLYEDQ